MTVTKNCLFYSLFTLFTLPTSVLFTDFFPVANAQSQAAKITGSWVTPCLADGKGSTQSMVTLEKNGNMIYSDVSYSDTACTTVESTEKTATSTYQINSDTKEILVLTTYVATAGDGEVSELVLEIKFTSDTKISVKCLKAIIISEGKPKPMTNEQVARIPLLSYTKKI